LRSEIKIFILPSVLKFLDLLTTYIGFELGAYEVNPFMRSLFNSIGVYTYFVSFLGTILAYILLYFTYLEAKKVFSRYVDEWFIFSYWLLNILLIRVVISNLMVICGYGGL